MRVPLPAWYLGLCAGLGVRLPTGACAAPVHEAEGPLSFFTPYSIQRAASVVITQASGCKQGL